MYSCTIPSTSALDGVWVVNATTRPLYPQERPGSHCTGDWVGPMAGLDGCGKSRQPHRDSIPTPSSSQRLAIPTELSRAHVQNRVGESSRRQEKSAQWKASCVVIFTSYWLSDQMNQNIGRVLWYVLGEDINVYRVLVGKLCRARRRWEYNIKMDIK